MLLPFAQLFLSTSQAPKSSEHFLSMSESNLINQTFTLRFLHCVSVHRRRKNEAAETEVANTSTN